MIAPTESSPFSPADLARHRLSAQEYRRITDLIGRHPNLNELGMFSVMWSEHCCYKNSRALLKGFPTTGPRVLVGPGENAGVIDVGDGLRVAFKVESHNHPSAVEPFQGAATGVGGILRDIFTMGARPIAVLNSLRFGPLEDARNRALFNGVVQGIGHYGNCTGIPTVGGEVYFDETYSGNPLVNAMAIGVLETPEIVRSGAAGIGNPVLYVGSTTGRDGMGGASFASAELSEESQKDRPAVQVGDPFTEKSLIEACLEAFRTGAVVAAQDMGAAGLTCSSSEMAAKGGVGIDLDLDRVPVRETGMVPYEFLLSESQERMLFVAHKGREGELIALFERWGLHAVVVGEVVADPIVRIRHRGEVVAELPAGALTDDAPLYEREVLSEPPLWLRELQAFDGSTLPLPADYTAALLQLLDSPNIASKRWVYRQYDHQVQNNTAIVPGAADAAVIRVRPQTFGVGEVTAVPAGERGIAATIDCNSRYVWLDPYRGAMLAVAEAARNLSCVGAEPLAVTDNLNFGSPEKPDNYWQLAMACRGIADACRAFKTPVTGGNVSLYNETTRDGSVQAIYPTPTIGMVGLVEDVRRVCSQGFKAAGDLVYLLGGGPPTLGGSEYLYRAHGLVAGSPPLLPLALECQVQSVCRAGIERGLFKSAHDLSEGGLAVALAECCIAGNLGLEATILDAAGHRPDVVLFGERAAAIVVSVDPAHRTACEEWFAAALGSHWQFLGTVAAADFAVALQGTNIAIQTPSSQLQTTWEQAIPRRMAYTPVTEAPPQ
ncbi:phosphoribosylformylglycinamidine synthase subunit PurL [Gloeobacter kilaueensis]|uniref:Phosphoribosylformylglycinamidine synthase subunit PurL n=1 Tax=Gloeobacter kilaueensis (strain ATCC BAA-2537 / CCAP 1431/1 / ULC 316 / JS1) TaxID=1183438 RepID=U5QQW4_GLOK1|nr:phosphoribosylformylglycinamidine synthase subunit PurL [Gloeobacter kilaueensis]AGY60034.1 phosphoribosylformylglycinamidine synthase II [Gloeobacter kilaueensis JS1]